jgi:Reverse transcriptase (RNA-dependent DNA polymerase)
MMPFGPKNAPAHFQQVMRTTLGELEGQCAMVYIDDIIIFSDNFEDHMKHVAQVFKKLEEVNLKVAKDKAHFCLKQVKLLGKVVPEAH